MRIWGKNMNKQILIGSIIAVAILIGVSFSSVVGYRSVASDVKASPLFNIRSSRAIDEESGDLSCEYVGMEDNINLLIPIRDNKAELTRKILERIKTMDDKTFNKLISSLIYDIKNNNRFRNVNINDVVTFFIQFKDNLEKNSIDYNTNNGNFTLYDTPTLCWFPGCVMLWIYAIIYGFILMTVLTSCFACDPN